MGARVWYADLGRRGISIVSGSFHSFLHISDFLLRCMMRCTWSDDGRLWTGSRVVSLVVVVRSNHRYMTAVCRTPFTERRSTPRTDFDVQRVGINKRQVSRAVEIYDKTLLSIFIRSTERLCAFLLVWCPPDAFIRVLKWNHCVKCVHLFCEFVSPAADVCIDNIIRYSNTILLLHNDCRVRRDPRVYCSICRVSSKMLWRKHVNTILFITHTCVRFHNYVAVNIGKSSRAYARCTTVPICMPLIKSFRVGPCVPITRRMYNYLWTTIARAGFQRNLGDARHSHVISMYRSAFYDGLQFRYTHWHRVSCT